MQIEREAQLEILEEEDNRETNNNKKRNKIEEYIQKL